MSKYATTFGQFRPSDRTAKGKKVVFFEDIDGCVDPGMLKHEDGFGTASIQHYRLQMVTELAKHAWMYVNCYSLDRGITRFKALYKWADLLRETLKDSDLVREGVIQIPEFKFLKRWANTTEKYSPEALDAYIRKGDFSEILQQGDKENDAHYELVDVLQWSNRVNSLVNATVENIKAFPNAAKSIKTAYEQGVDLIAVSGTPETHVIAQLTEYGLIDYFIAIFAQQAGKKRDAIRAVLESKKYDISCMFGDAPEDNAQRQKANSELSGNENGSCRMYFIKAGKEDECWRYFNEIVLEKLVVGAWPAEEESRLVQEATRNLDRLWVPTPRIETFPIKEAK